MTTTIAPALGHGALDTQQGIGTTPGYDAIDRRRFFTGFERGEGVSTYGSYRISQRGAGANMSVDINQDDGAYIRGDAVQLQGLYQVPAHNATINETVAAADATNPRIDRVILEIKDNVHDGGGSNLAQTRVVTGTPSVGATLDNLTGAAAVPNSAVLLADVLVPAASSSVVDANIRDRRPFVAGVVPPLLTRVDGVKLVPLAARIDESGSSGPDLSQTAMLVVLPRRIVAATRIRWRYIQGGTALTGNYVFGIYDATGRKIIDTGSIAITGTAGTIQQRSETITATTLEAGMYYLFFGIDTTNAGSWTFPGMVGASVSGPNQALQLGGGGLTVPATILGLTDQSGANITGSVPSAELTVG